MHYWLFDYSKIALLIIDFILYIKNLFKTILA